jgi:hypothetical protein
MMMAKGHGGGQREPVFDKDQNHIGDIERGHHEPPRRPRKIARGILMLAVAVGFGYFLATPRGQQTMEGVMEMFAPSSNVR